MSKTVSFKCNESSTQLFVQILNKLAIAGEKNLTRKIRVGGDEYSFIGGSDTVSDLSIDGSLYVNFTDAEKRDIAILRDAIVAPRPVPASPTDTVDNQNDSDGVPDFHGVPDASNGNDNDEDDEDDDILNSAEAIAVKDVIADKVSQNQMFTAFDITKELRKKGQQVSHYNIKRIVHTIYNNGDMQGYDRSLVNIAGVPLQPFLYHPMSADPAVYQS